MYTLFCLFSAYGYGVLSVIIISLLALVGALLIPCINKTFLKYILSLFVAMGVATLLADALLHLLPLVCLLYNCTMLIGSCWHIEKTTLS